VRTNIIDWTTMAVVVRIREYPNKPGFGIADIGKRIIGYQIPVEAMVLVCALTRTPWVLFDRDEVARMGL
jgi:hypothetical protein